jgi:hypothetical protein
MNPRRLHPPQATASPVRAAPVGRGTARERIHDAHLTGTDTHVPDWVGTLFTLSGILMPGGAAIYSLQTSAAAPAAVPSVSGAMLALAPATP